MRVLNRPARQGRQVQKLLERTLDGRFTLAYQVAVPGYANRVSALLLGPHGILVLGIVEGALRARCLGENWYVMDPKTKNFAERPSPVKAVHADVRAVEVFLQARQLGSVVPLDCALLVPDSSSQVESLQPAVPIFRHDQIVDMAKQLADQREMVEWTVADDVLKGLNLRPQRQPWNAVRQRAKRAAPAGGRGAWGLQRRQILVLAGLALADIALLAAGLAIVLFMQ